MNEKLTVQQLLDKFSGFRETPSGVVIIHPGLPSSFIELKSEFVKRLKNELEHKLMLAFNGIEDLSATDIFTIEILRDSY